MFGASPGLQPLPVERAAGLPQAVDNWFGQVEQSESNAAALHLEKQSLLPGRQETVSEGNP